LVGVERIAGPAPSADVLIAGCSLTKVYGKPPGFTAVKGIDFQVCRGEAFGFLGPNGAGKSSTMRMIGCVSPATRGTLRIFGLDAVRDATRIKARIGSVPQDDALDTEMTVRENLWVYGRYFGLPRAVIRMRIERLLDFAQLTEKANAQVESLSGGMKRRLTITRSLINNPEILLLDEPTTGLDPQARHLLWDRLFRLKQDGVTLILTTHYMDEAEQLCDRIAVMDRGEIIALGSPRELIERHVTREVAELRFAPGQQQKAAQELHGVGDDLELLPDRVLCYSQDGEAVVEEVHRRGLSPITTLVRRSSLEDVFLRLTGRSLIE
jgi:lipooligosaccharide transport system ATP-binding protein